MEIAVKLESVPPLKVQNIIFYLTLLLSTVAVASVNATGEQGTLETINANAYKTVASWMKRYEYLPIVLSIMAGFLLLICVFFIYFLYRRRVHEPTTLATLPQDNVASASAAQRNDPAIIQTFPLRTFPCEGLDTFGESCGCCLEDFTDGESVRSLPSCGHIFHLGCIQGWVMRGWTWCPHCRTAFVDS